MLRGTLAAEQKRVGQSVLGLLLLCFLLYIWDLGLTPFYNYEEPKEALIVWEMVHGGGWILPLRNGEEIPLKPPLLHWLGALFTLLSGKLNEFTIRLPSALASTTGVLLTFFFARSLAGWRAGLLSALILATSPEWMRWAVIARSDMLLAVFSAAALMLFWHLWGERKPPRWKTYGFYILLGLATLAKGPVGVVVPGLIVLGFLVACRDLAFLRRLHLLEGVAIFSLVSLSWYLLAWRQGGGEFLQRQILDENLFRFLRADHGGPSRDHTFYYYLPTLFVGMFPWSLFFLPLLSFLLYHRARLKEKRLLYPTVWCLVTLGFFTLASGKRSNYILVLYPAAAVLLGVWWHTLAEGKESGMARKLATACAYTLCFLFFLVFLVLLTHGAGFDLDHWAAPLLHPRDRANVPLVAHTLQSHFSLVGVWLACLGIALLFYLWGLKKQQWVSVFSALTICISSSLYFAHALFRPLLAQPRTYKPFMLGVRSTVRDAPLFFYQAQDYGAIFYAGRRIATYPHDLSQGLPDGATSPLFLLMWEKTWQNLSQNRHLKLLAVSEGKGPDKKRRLALVMLLPGQATDQKAGEQGSKEEEG